MTPTGLKTNARENGKNGEIQLTYEPVDISLISATPRGVTTQ